LKICIILAPSLFKRCPLIGLGYLSAYLRERGHQIKIFDLNTEMDVTFDYDEQKWNDKEFVEGFISEKQDEIKTLLAKIMGNNPDIIGFSIWATTRHFSLMLAKTIKQEYKDKLIVFGGPECSFTGSDLIRQEGVDVVVYGEGEKTFAEIVEMYEK